MTTRLTLVTHNLNSRDNPLNSCEARLKFSRPSFTSRNHPFNSRNSPVEFSWPTRYELLASKWLSLNHQNKRRWNFPIEKIDFLFENSITGHFSGKWIASGYPSNHTGFNVTGLTSVRCLGTESIAGQTHRRTDRIRIL